MLILGINAFHGDAAAAVVLDGKIVAAVEEERFNRVKHWAGLPTKSVAYCLAEIGARLSDIDHFAVSFSPRANLLRRAAFALRRGPQGVDVSSKIFRMRRAMDLRARLATELDEDPATARGTLHFVEHHAAHAASAFFPSPFERAAVLTVDGMGDFTSTTFGVGNGSRVSRHHAIHFPHSIGYLYNAITLYLGFHAYGDEYKVMGLAPYGRPRYLDAMRTLVRLTREGFKLNLDYFSHHREGIALRWNDEAPVVSPFHSPALERLFGGPALPPRSPMGPREEDIAHSLQCVTEEVLMSLYHQLHARTRVDDVAVAGGVAMNSVANGKITTSTPFRRFFCPGAAADNGTSFGAALHVWHEVLGRPERHALTDLYLGPSPSQDAAHRAASIRQVRIEALDQDTLLNRTAQALADGQIIGWFQGRMEFGARALGNRTLLADPRRADMRDVINTKIKFRERFRPFAPSILEEHVGDYFEHAQPSPFMERVLRIRPERRTEIPAVTHVDGTGRLHTVSRTANPLYWSLIDRFRRLTGVPVVLNTSLNENEPIVNLPEEAVDCFLRTRMDAIVLGDLYLTRA
ncbi:MAG: carbamoyltransferase [Gemmatimonadaceae bacterium]|nr:carbamoyltransferase [Gemmatimonadaceae bacterium]